jgi:hypothetical protein
LFNAQKVLGHFHNADGVLLTAFIAANGAVLAFAQVVAVPAFAGVLPQISKGLRKSLKLVLGLS